jgi:hypothetical protein
MKFGVAYVTKPKLRGLISREPATLGFGTFQFSPFIQLILFLNNTAATHSMSKSTDKVRCRFTIRTFIEIIPTFWVLLLLRRWTDMMKN